jgi:hypothetical protein
VRFAGVMRTIVNITWKHMRFAFWP